MSHERPSIEHLQRLRTLADLTPKELKVLAGRLHVEQATSGTRLISRGDTEDFSLYLMEGELELEAEDGRVSQVTANQDRALSPVAQLLPRKYNVTASTPVRYLRIEAELMVDLQPGGSDSASDSGLLVSSTRDDESDGANSTAIAFESDLSYSLYQDLNNDTLVLPSLPDVAVRIGRAIRDEMSDAHRIAQIAQTDPAIAAKLVKAANSALYGGHKAVDSCAAAVVRLGTDLTHKLVLSFAMKELFQTKSKLLQKRMHDLWEHSTQVAAISLVLAKHDNDFDPEHALLAGLIHDVGVIAILNYARDFPDVQRNKSVLDEAISRLRGQIGNMILRKWEFPDDLATVALEAENWYRDPSPAADYCDLVIIAQLHSYVGSKRMRSLPAIDQVPAYKKMDLGELSPAMSLKILDEASDQIAQAQALLNAP